MRATEPERRHWQNPRTKPAKPTAGVQGSRACFFTQRIIYKKLGEPGGYCPADGNTVITLLSLGITLA